MISSTSWKPKKFTLCTESGRIKQQTGALMTHPARFIEISDKKIFLATRLFIFSTQSTDNTRLQENNKHLFIGCVCPLNLFVTTFWIFFIRVCSLFYTLSPHGGYHLSVSALFSLIAGSKLELGTESNKTSLQSWTFYKVCCRRTCQKLNKKIISAKREGTLKEN